MPHQATRAELHNEVPPEFLVGSRPPRDYGAAGMLVQVHGGAPIVPARGGAMPDEAGRLQAAPGEVLIQHPEVEGAVMRVPTEAYDPKVHTLWDLEGPPPWRDGAGNPLPGAEPPAGPPRRSGSGSSKRKSAVSEPDAE